MGAECCAHPGPGPYASYVRSTDVVICKPPKPCEVQVRGEWFVGHINQWSRRPWGWVAIVSFTGHDRMTYSEIAEADCVVPVQLTTAP